MKKRCFCSLLAMMLALFITVSAYASQAFMVAGTTNYLALRCEPKTAANNEIGRLYNGQNFYVDNWNINGFAYGYTAQGVYGYVNNNYLIAYQQPASVGVTCTVAGVSNYLGLRTTPTRNASDEIGRLYNGQQFTVLEFRADGFAYGIAPNGQRGYVVSSYLR